SHVLNINGPEVVSWNEYVERFGDALQVPNRVTPNSVQLTSMIFGSAIIRDGGSLLKSRFKPLFKKIASSGPTVMAVAKSLADLYPTPVEFSLLRRKVRYGWEKAARELGFRPMMSLRDGLAQSANWCRTHGIVNIESDTDRLI